MDESFFDCPANIFDSSNEHDEQEMETQEVNSGDNNVRLFVCGPLEEDYDEKFFESLIDDEEEDDGTFEFLSVKSSLNLLLKFKGIEKMPEENRSLKTYVLSNVKNMKRKESGKKMRHHDGIGKYINSNLNIIEN